MNYEPSAILYFPSGRRTSGRGGTKRGIVAETVVEFVPGRIIFSPPPWENSVPDNWYMGLIGAGSGIWMRRLYRYTLHSTQT